MLNYAAFAALSKIVFLSVMKGLEVYTNRRRKIMSLSSEDQNLDLSSTIGEKTTSLNWIACKPLIDINACKKHKI